MIEFMLSILGKVDVEARPAVCIPTLFAFALPLVITLPLAVFFWPRFPIFVKTPVIPSPIAFPPSATPFGALVSTSSMPLPMDSNADGVGQPIPGNPFFEPGPDIDKP
jgi:hypothetical protein